MDENLLAAVLAQFGERLTAIEGALNNVRPAPESTTIERTLQTFATVGQPASDRLVPRDVQSTEVGEPIPDWAALSQSNRLVVTEGFDTLPLNGLTSQRPKPSTLSRSGIGSGEIAAQEHSRVGVDFTIEATRGYLKAPPPDDRVALSGQQFIRASDDQFVQVRSEDGRLLGAMPSFPADIERINTQDGHTLSVGMVAVRSVVVPYNQGINPFHIQGFIPAPGVQEGPLTTGVFGAGLNLDNPDIGRRV